MSTIPPEFRSLLLKLPCHKVKDDSACSHNQQDLQIELRV